MSGDDDQRSRYGMTGSPFVPEELIEGLVEQAIRGTISAQDVAQRFGPEVVALVGKRMGGRVIPNPNESNYDGRMLGRIDRYREVRSGAMLDRSIVEKFAGVVERATVSPQEYAERKIGDLEQVVQNYRRDLEQKNILIDQSQRELNQMRVGKENAEKNLAGAQAAVQNYVEMFQKLQETACPYAVVHKLRNEEKPKDAKVVILFAGKSLEVNWPVRPSGEPHSLRVGQKVKVAADTMQIVAPVEEEASPGEIVEVVRVSRPGLCEVERAGTQRAVTYDAANMPLLEDGDRVVLDDSGQVVVLSLGKPPSDNAVDQATGVSWDDIGGLAEAKAQMREAIEGPTRNRKLYERFGQRRVKGVLLHGPPGTGKTMLGKAAATAMAELHGEKAKGGFLYVKGPELLSKWVGETETGIRKLFAAARRHHKKNGYPAVIFLDEADAILGKRGGTQAFTLATTTVPQFLSEMDGLEDSGAFVLLATNRPDTLDPAVVRDGRIDRKIHVARPTEEDARAIFQRHLSRRPLALPAEELSAHGARELYSHHRVLYRVKRESKGILTDKMLLSHVVSGAMVAGVVDRATAIAMRRVTESSGFSDEELEGVEVPMVLGADDVTRAVLQVHEESLAVNHDDELVDFCRDFMIDVQNIEKVRHA